MTQEPYPTPTELKLAREYGTTRGILDGQREALSRVESEAYLDAHHSQLRAAGLCRCDEMAAAQASPATAPMTDLAGLSDSLAGFVAELGRIASILQPKPVEVEVLHVGTPELKREVDGFLAGLGERARARSEAGVRLTVPDHMLRDSEPSEMAVAEAGRLVDADETPAAPEQPALDDPISTPFLPRRVPNQQ